MNVEDVCCKTLHDRDENASINIKKFGYIRFQGTGIEEKQSLSERLPSRAER
jgi:transposase